MQDGHAGQPPQPYPCAADASCQEWLVSPQRGRPGPKPAQARNSTDSIARLPHISSYISPHLPPVYPGARSVPFMSLYVQGPAYLSDKMALPGF